MSPDSDKGLICYTLPSLDRSCSSSLGCTVLRSVQNDQTNLLQPKCSHADCTKYVNIFEHDIRTFIDAKCLVCRISYKKSCHRKHGSKSENTLKSCFICVLEHKRVSRAKWLNIKKCSNKFRFARRSDARLPYPIPTRGNRVCITKKCKKPPVVALLIPVLSFS